MGKVYHLNNLHLGSNLAIKILPAIILSGFSDCCGIPVNRAFLTMSIC